MIGTYNKAFWESRISWDLFSMFPPRSYSRVLHSKPRLGKQLATSLGRKAIFVSAFLLDFMGQIMTDSGSEKREGRTLIYRYNILYHIILYYIISYHIILYCIIYFLFTNDLPRPIPYNMETFIKCQTLWWHHSINKISLWGVIL